MKTLLSNSATIVLSIFIPVSSIPDICVYWCVLWTKFHTKRL